MKSIALSSLTKVIHFPITQAMHTPVKKKSFFKRLFNFITYRRKFTVRQDYALWCPYLDQYIFVPDCFIFDGASVPKILNGVYSSTGMLLLGALPHDFGYKYNGLFHVNLETGELFFVLYSKSELDKIFNSLNAYESGMETASNVATGTLSLLGYFAWKKHRKTNSNLYEDFPQLR